jgi:hypothetical protein
MHTMSQKCYISRSRGDGTPSTILIKFGTLVCMINIINFAKFDYFSCIGLDLAMV